jgi:hypothetical protein
MPGALFDAGSIGQTDASLSRGSTEGRFLAIEHNVKRLLPSVVGIAALVGVTVAFAGSNSETSARLVHVTSPVAPGAQATLVAHVAPAHRCTITVEYKSGPSVARGLYPKRSVHGRVSWTWMVGTNTTRGRWPIRVNCGSAGSFRTSFRVAR